ncbi:hypothetical protein HanRHA438_Chr10g0477781 [Helianthus annuus]|nr:hypothetical protein HanHA300_Chr10g0382321 [Helianthus annuus]KAJ0524171.1 hypothetical protein HanIR_Chr10g0501641 [Helianthus annuus]KAJ0531787.1 hypothetical protein HanHA89_Chr10g0404781 [Helianthus annuus]KAJ0881769.1 hypothetical protein HanRHA438_Chr10g0477781 [Helianthus annuus]
MGGFCCLYILHSHFINSSQLNLRSNIYLSMATANSHISLLLLLALVALTPSTSAASPNLDLDLHLLLQLQGFPPGLIPEPVEDYDISIASILPPTFSFTVYFKEPCYVTYVYPNYFAPVFTGKITLGKISGMRGHKDKLPSTGVWTDMYDVTMVGTKLVFKFATETIAYDRALFEEVKNCTYGPLIPDQSNELVSQLPISAE